MKDVTVQVRITRAEADHWRQAAKADDRTLSAWIRRQSNATAHNLRERSGRVL